MMKVTVIDKNMRMGDPWTGLYNCDTDYWSEEVSTFL